MRIAVSCLAICVAVPSFALDQVTYLGAFDTVGSDVSVTPLDDTRLEYCWTTTSGQAHCETYVYSLVDGTARFASFSDGRFEFDLVTNVLSQTRPDGVVKFADMTPIAR